MIYFLIFHISDLNPKSSNGIISTPYFVSIVVSKSLCYHSHWPFYDHRILDFLFTNLFPYRFSTYTLFTDNTNQLFLLECNLSLDHLPLFRHLCPQFRHSYTSVVTIQITTFLKLVLSYCIRLSTLSNFRVYFWKNKKRSDKLELLQMRFKISRFGS